MNLNKERYENGMTEETLETIILGHITIELKDEIQIARQVNLAKTIMQALRIHDVVGRNEQCVLHSIDRHGKCFKCDEQVFTKEQE